MPALNIMATQETVLNSGSSPSWPRVIFPYRLMASQSAKTTKPVAVSMKNQPPLCIRPLSMSVETFSSESVATPPQTTKARVRTAVTPNTTRSVCGDRPAGSGAAMSGAPPPPSAFC